MVPGYVSVENKTNKHKYRYTSVILACMNWNFTANPFAIQFNCTILSVQAILTTNQVENSTYLMCWNFILLWWGKVTLDQDMNLSAISKLFCFGRWWKIVLDRATHHVGRRFDCNSFLPELNFMAKPQVFSLKYNNMQIRIHVELNWFYPRSQDGDILNTHTGRRWWWYFSRMILVQKCLTSIDSIWLHVVLKKWTEI